MPRCPYCGYDVGFAEVFSEKNKPVYKCRRCGEKSEIVLTSALYRTLWLTQLIAVIVFVATVLAGGGFSLLGIISVILIFLGFYAIAPYLIVFEKPTFIKKKLNLFEKLDWKFSQAKEKSKKRKEKKQREKERAKEECEDDEISSTDFLQVDKKEDLESTKEDSDRDIFSS